MKEKVFEEVFGKECIAGVFAKSRKGSWSPRSFPKRKNSNYGEIYI